MKYYNQQELGKRIRHVRWAAIILALLCFSTAAYFCGKIYYTEKEYAEGDAVYEDILADVVISEEEVLAKAQSRLLKQESSWKKKMRLCRQRNLLCRKLILFL